MTLTVLCGLFKMVNFMFVTFTPPKKKVCVLKMGASNSKSPRKALPGLASAICPSLNQSLWTVIVHNHCGQQCCCWPGLTSVPTTRAPL